MKSDVRSGKKPPLPFPKLNKEASPTLGGKIFFESRFATMRSSKISGLSDGRSESVKQPKY